MTQANVVSITDGRPLKRRPLEGLSIEQLNRRAEQLQRELTQTLLAMLYYRSPPSPGPGRRRPIAAGVGRAA